MELNNNKSIQTINNKMRLFLTTVFAIFVLGKKAKYNNILSNYDISNNV